jgi:hypothetical protein
MQMVVASLLRRFTIASACVLGFGWAAHAETLIGPVYPPVGYGTVTATGSPTGASPADPGGRTVSYSFSAFNNSPGAALYWGQVKDSIDVVTASGINTLTFTSGIGSSTAVWSGQSQVFSNIYHDTETINTQFKLTLLNGGTFGAPPTGATNDADYLVTGDFQVKLEFLGEVQGRSSTYSSLNQVFNSLNPAGQIHTDNSGGFYYTVPDVGTAAPLPPVALGGMALFGGLATGKIRRRFARRA